MDQSQNGTGGVVMQNETEGTRLELYSIVLSTTIMILAILFGGGGCITVLIAMFMHRLLRKLRFVFIGILLLVCCFFDLVWCPIEIARLVIHHQNINGNIVSAHTVRDLKYFGSSLYILLLCTIASIIVLICVQNLLKIIRKYDTIPKMTLGVCFVLIWLIISISLTIAYILVSNGDQDDQVYHSINRNSFYFKLGLQTLWITLLLLPIILMALIYFHTKFYKTKLQKEISELPSTDNFTVPSLIIKSFEEMADEEMEESSIAASPSSDKAKDSASGSPVSKSSKSALSKKTGSPSSQKVVFADTPKSTREDATASKKIGENFKSPNHLGVNMAAILGRRRHTIAQISDPNIDLLQKAKTYNYVRKFSVDISALQAQLENPKLSNNFPFRSQQDIISSPEDGLEKDNQSTGSQQKIFNRQSMDEIMKGQEIAEEPEKENEEFVNQSNETKTEMGNCETESFHSQNVSICSARSIQDSVCPTPPLISLTQSNGEERQIEIMNDDNNFDESNQSKQFSSKFITKPCKLSCLLVATFILSILPMFVTELLRDHGQFPDVYINLVTCMTAVTSVQTMIYPQMIFCIDTEVNKAVNQFLTRTRMRILQLFSNEHVVATEDVSDTEV